MPNSMNIVPPVPGTTPGPEWASDINDILTTSEYGVEFVSSFAKNNLVGAQFHPEKSHKFGASFLKRFAEGYCNA